MWVMWSMTVTVTYSSVLHKSQSLLSLYTGSCPSVTASSDEKEGEEEENFIRQRISVSVSHADMQQLFTLECGCIMQCEEAPPMKTYIRRILLHVVLIFHVKQSFSQL